MVFIPIRLQRVHLQIDYRCLVTSRKTPVICSAILGSIHDFAHMSNESREGDIKKIKCANRAAHKSNHLTKASEPCHEPF